MKKLGLLLGYQNWLLFWFTILLISVFLPHVAGSQDRGGLGFQKNSQLQWEDERVTGGCKNVPVKSLLSELSQEKNFQLVIIGELNQRVDISFDHLTLEQSIKKIMRLMDLSYFMVLDGAGSSDRESPYRIRKLIICQKGKRSPPPRPSRRLPRGHKKQVETVVEKPPPEQEEAEDLAPQRPSRDTGERRKAVSRKFAANLEGSPEDLREYIDKLSTEGAITPDEYEMMLEEIEEKEQ